MTIQRLTILILILASIIGITAATRSGSATTLCVNPGGTGGCFATIQAAINAAGPGDTINVAPGTYTENVVLNKSVTLNGAQAGANACTRSGSESIITPANPSIRTLELQTGSAGAIIDGFTFSGGTRGIESTSGPINNLQILNNQIIGFTGSGVFLNDNGIDITVARNFIDGASKTGSGDLFHLDTDSFAGFHLLNNCIVGKGVTDTSADTSTGFFVDGNHNVGTSATPRKPVISGNLISECQTGMNLGTRAFGSLTVPNTGTITNNTFSDNVFDGLQGGIQNTLIAGNTFSGNGRSGLALTSFGNTGADRGAQKCTISCNTITGNGFTQNSGDTAGGGITFSSTQALGTITTNHANNNNISGNFAGARYNGTETPIDMENNWWGSATGPTVASNPGGTGDRIAGPGAANIDYIPFKTAVIPDSDGDGLLDACDTVIKVTPSNLQTWQMQHAHCSGGASTGSQQFVTGPGTPPLGTGSLRFTIGSDGDSFETVRYPGLDMVRIDQLTKLEYSTYVTNFNSGQAPYILLNIDFNGDTAIDDQLFFEPVYQSAAFFPSNPQAQVVEGQWQTWDALNGGWWSLNDICGAGPGANVKSLAQYLSCQPNARIINGPGGLGGFRIATGCGGPAWAGFDGNIDNVTIAVNTAETTFDFDPDPCTLTCPPNQTAVAGPVESECCAPVTYPDPTGPGCGTIICTPPSGTCFPVGTTTVNCGTVEDGPSCTFTVTVTDPPPVITCPPNQTLTADANCQAVATYTATATDNCTASPTVECTPPSGSTFPKGTTTVTCTATDGSSNISSCTFTVTVNDTQPPSISCPANVTRSNDPNQCGAVVTYPPATASDNCPGVGTPACSPASGSFFPKGATTVTCTVTDSSSNSASCTFTVTVNDTQPPSITCPANITKPNDPNQCGAAATFAPTVSDNCPGAGTACSPASGSFFPKGTTTVTCTATDTSGNTASCSFTVTVNDTQPPVITCPPNQTAKTATINDPCVVVTFAAPTASDNCPGVTAACTPASGSCFPVGTTTVTCTATDTSGNTATCSFTVTVFNVCLQDDSNPTIVFFGNTISGAYRFCCGGTVYTGVATVTRRGNVATFQHNAPDRRVQATDDESVFKGTASLQSPPGTIRCTITDKDTRNNACVCP